MAAAEQHRPRMFDRLNMLISIGHHALENRLEHFKGRATLEQLSIQSSTKVRLRREADRGKTWLIARRKIRAPLDAVVRLGGRELIPVVKWRYRPLRSKPDRSGPR